MEVHEMVIIEQNDQDMKAPDLDSFQSICRICLTPCIPDFPATVKNIHDQELQMHIRSLIETYAYIKIPAIPDNLPQHICHKCVTFLIEIHTFRMKCRINEDLLIKVRRRELNKEAFHKELITPQCKTIEDEFQDQAQKLIDKINHERMAIFQCKDCPSIYNSKKELTAHRNEVKHSRRKASKCPYCDKMFNTTVLAQHIRVHTKEKPFTCEICVASFTLKSNLKRHMRIHENEKLFTCEVCGKSYNRQSSLNIHLKRHDSSRDNTGEEGKIRKQIYDGEFKCLECGKGFDTQEQVKIHMRNHNKRFLCPDCGKVFATKANLITHIRVHTGEKPFVCDICKKSFSQPSSLRTHQVIHTGERLHQCKVCNRSFAVRGNLVAHERMHAGDTPFRCNFCMKFFCTSSTLRKHMRKHTKQGKNQLRQDEEFLDEETSHHVKEEADEEKIEFIAMDNKDGENLKDHKVLVVQADKNYVDGGTQHIVIEEYEEIPEGYESNEAIQVIYTDGLVYEDEGEGVEYEGGTEVCISEEDGIGNVLVEPIVEVNIN